MAHQAQDPNRPLRLALRANALFSSTCALLFVMASRRIGAWIGAPGPLLIGLGVGLLVFAAMLWITSRRSDPGRLHAEARGHCAADLAWVVGSAPIIVSGWLTPAGSAALAAVSAVVLAMAIAQWRGIGAGRTALAT